MLAMITKHKYRFLWSIQLQQYDRITDITHEQVTWRWNVKLPMVVPVPGSKERGQYLVIVVRADNMREGIIEADKAKDAWWKGQSP